ncbi:MAG: MSMEG_4193 family putative phosphomutase [Actinomycetota bacterium]
MTTVFLVRHALTPETGRKLSGWTPGVHLNADGLAQADATAEYLRTVPLKAVYSSPIDRAVETARVIAAHHKLQVKVRRAIGEIEYGKWTDRSFKTLRRTKLWEVVQRWPSGARFPDGESLVEVQTRAVREIERIREEHPKDAVCCVSHADVIRLVAAHYLGMHIDLYQRIVIFPASVTTVGFGSSGPSVLALNALPMGIGKR